MIASLDITNVYTLFADVVLTSPIFVSVLFSVSVVPWQSTST